MGERMSFLQRRGWALKPAFWLTLVFTVVMAIIPDPTPVAGTSAGMGAASGGGPGALAALLAPLQRLGEIDDRLQHIIAFATMAALAAAAFPGTPLVRLAERLSFFGAVLELVQALPFVHRDCQLEDWLFDSAAVFAVLYAVQLMRQRARRTVT